jgi:hypothetical protein
MTQILKKKFRITFADNYYRFNIGKSFLELENYKEREFGGDFGFEECIAKKKFYLQDSFVIIKDITVNKKIENDLLENKKNGK